MEPGSWWGPALCMFWIFPLLCMIFMVAMMVMMFRRGGCMPMRHGHTHASNDGRETPSQILDRRYASGEISREQYEESKRTLETR